VPPMYSALKLAGKPLYKLARKGIQVERTPRRVTIHAITLRAWESPDATIDVRCSPGTYIRSLAHDIGAALGCGAHLIALTRLASGSFTIEDAVELKDLEGVENLGGLLRPIDAALQDLPIVTLDADSAQRVLMGHSIPLSGWDGSPLCRVYDANARLLAIMEYDSAVQLLRPKKVLADEKATASS
jgi:tRNA pseudouridine55 synthase